MQTYGSKIEGLKAELLSEIEEMLKVVDELDDIKISDGVSVYRQLDVFIDGYGCLSGEYVYINNVYEDCNEVRCILKNSLSDKDGNHEFNIKLSTLPLEDIAAVADSVKGDKQRLQNMTLRNELREEMDGS